MEKSTRCRRGTREKFIVRVCQTEDRGMKGQVTLVGAQEKKETEFRSAMELLKIIDSSLDQIEPKEIVTREGENR